MTDPIRRFFTPAALAMSLLALQGCQLFEDGGDSPEEIADRAGRVDMVIGSPELEASPELASQTIEIGIAETVADWGQAGGNSQKVVGHVAAAPEMVVAWRRDIGAGSGRDSALTAPPVYDGTAIYALDANQTVRAVSPEGGAQLWSVRLQSANRRDRRAIGGGIAAEGGRVYASSGFGLVTALDARDGSVVWRQEFTAPMTGAPTLHAGRLLVTSNNNEVFALDQESGETLWSDQAISEPARVLGAPSVAAVQDIAVAPFSSGELIAYRDNNGRKLWTDALARSSRFTPISAINDIPSRPVLAAGLVFASNQSGLTVAIDGRTGNRAWTAPIGSTGAPLLAGSVLFVSGTDGRIAALDAGSGEAYWVSELRAFGDEERSKDAIVYTSPVLASGRLLVASSRGELIALDPQTGTETARIPLGKTQYIEPIVVGSQLVFLDDSGQLIAVR